MADLALEGRHAGSRADQTLDQAGFHDVVGDRSGSVGGHQIERRPAGLLQGGFNGERGEAALWFGGARVIAVRAGAEAADLGHDFGAAMLSLFKLFEYEDGRALAGNEAVALLGEGRIGFACAAQHASLTVG